LGEPAGDDHEAVSRVIAQIIGIHDAKTSNDTTVRGMSLPSQHVHQIASPESAKVARDPRAGNT